MTPQEKQKVFELKKNGMSKSEIAKAMSIAFSTISDIYDKYTDDVLRIDICPCCGNDFIVSKHKEGRPSSFCSHNCKVAYTKRFKTRRHVLCTCKRCGKQFYKYTFTKQKFCCYKCAMDYRYGR